jgi:DNA-binding NtrC family response regulator
VADPEIGVPKERGADPRASRKGLQSGGELSLREQVRVVSRRLESEIILRALERSRWNRRRASQVLQISYRSLLYKMKKCGLRDDGEASSEGKD